MDYCHMIYHVNANNFVTVSISTIGVEILAMTSFVASHVRVTCFNDVISRHLTPVDLSVPTVGTWKPIFGFFIKSFFPQWIASEVEMFAIVANMCHRLKYENFKSLPHKDTTSVNSKFHLPYASTNQTSDTQDKISNFDCSIKKKNDFSVFTFLVMVDKLERVENNFIFVSHPNDVIIWLWKYDSLTNEIKFIPFPLSGSRTISLVVLFGQWKHANWSRVWDVSKAIRPNV